MQAIRPSVELLDSIDGIAILKKIELAGRTCYRSQNRITEESCKVFVKNLIAKGHETVLEHEKITFKVICDRGVSHELVRHRLASYSQASTRYINYKNDDMMFIDPCFWSEDDYKKAIWVNHMRQCEQTYKKLIESGAKPEEARSILPNSLQTEVVVTMNFRELRHFLKLRCANTAHPQMREIALELLNKIRKVVPVIFDDIIVSL